jgi:hypothetical protein
LRPLHLPIRIGQRDSQAHHDWKPSFLEQYMPDGQTTTARSLRVLFLAAGLWACLPPPGLAQAPPALTITGKIGEAGTPGQVVLDLAALERLPQHSFSTNSPWTKKPHKYTGPLLRDVLALVKSRGTQIHAIALNEYKVTIPVEDARRFDVIVAHRIDDKPIPVRERGPFFVIYPFDRERELRSALYYGRSIWQLKSMAIE